MQRLYFLTDSTDSARQITDRLLQKRVPEENIHVLASSADLPADLPEATPDEKSDFWPALFKGIGVGAVTGLIFALGVAASPLLAGGVGTQGPVILLITLFGGLAGALGAAIIGISVPSSLLERFDREMARGRLVLMVYVPAKRIQEIRESIRQVRPDTRYCGIEPLKPAFP